MPTKDPEKLKAARKRADAKRAGAREDTRHLSWTFVLYPESAPADWRDYLDSSFVPWVESPVHDKDVNADGTPKKPHIHVGLSFPSVKTRQQVVAFLKPLNVPSPQQVMSMRGLVRYMAHLDNPEKHQYNTAEIKGHCGFDVAATMQSTVSEQNALIREMMQYVKDHACDFYDLCNVAMESRPDWFDTLNSKAYLVREFCKARRYHLQDQMYRATRVKQKLVDTDTGEIVEPPKELSKQEQMPSFQNRKGHVSRDRTAKDSSQGSAQADRASGAERP